MVKDGTFREDLFYRISVIPMELPPLYERGADIAELTEHFIKKYCAQTGRSTSISPQALRLLEAYSWPGNVRELEHTIERAVALAKTYVGFDSSSSRNRSLSAPAGRRFRRSRERFRPSRDRRRALRQKPDREEGCLAVRLTLVREHQHLIEPPTPLTYMHPPSRSGF